MHSDGQTNLLDNPRASIGPLPWSSDPPLACDAPDSGAAAERMRRFSLAQEHRDLDDIIAVLMERCIPDEALIARLKKKKLHLKDEMVRLEAALAA